MGAWELCRSFIKLCYQNVIFGAPFFKGYVKTTRLASMSNHELLHLLLSVGNQLNATRAISKVKVLEEYDRESYVVDGYAV